MTALRRIRTKFFGAMLVVGAGSFTPAAAQNSQQPVDVTAAPPPSADTVGPSQLRDFSLGGQVARPAPAPAPNDQVAPAVSPTQAANRATPNLTQRTAPKPRELNPSPVEAPPQRDAGPQPDVADVPSRPLPLDVVTPGNSGEAAATGPLAPDVGLAASNSSSPKQSSSYWPWLAAMIAALGAAGYWWRLRQAGDERDAEPAVEALVGANARAEPAADAPSPAPPAPAAVSRVLPDGLVTSTALKPILDFQFKPDRIVVTESEAVVQFDLRIANVGAAPARNLLVEGLMVCAGPTQDQEIAQFFRHPNGGGERIPGIAPMDALALKSAVRLPIDQLKTFMAGDRTLFVPLVAFNFIYGNDNQQVSASYLVGRGKDEDDKLAPVRLDLGPRVFRNLSARQHSAGLGA